MVNYIVITTNREIADNMIDVLNNDILLATNSIELGKANHETGYSTVQLIPKGDNDRILADDIFWLGLYTGLNNK